MYLQLYNSDLYEIIAGEKYFYLVLLHRTTEMPHSKRPRNQIFHICEQCYIAVTLMTPYCIVCVCVRARAHVCMHVMMRTLFQCKRSNTNSFYCSWPCIIHNEQTSQ